MPLKAETSSELRGMVRDLLREALADRGSTPGGAEAVRIANDADLASFVAHLIQPATLDAVRSGKLRFTLQGGTPPVTASAGLEGVVTEQKLNSFTAASTLVLAAGAVLTPLARDKARRLGLKIERRR